MSFDVWERIFTRSSARSKTVQFLCFVVERKEVFQVWRYLQQLLRRETPVVCFWIFFEFFFSSSFLQKFKHTSFSPLCSQVQKNALVLCPYLLRVHINIAENTHQDTYYYKYSVRSFSVLVSSRWRSDAHAWAPEEKLLVFGVFSKSKIFRPHKFLSFFLWGCSFKKKQTPSTSLPPAPPNVSSPVKFINAFSIEEEEEKKRKKKLQISSLAVSYYIHTYKELAQRRRSKTERRRATH